MSNSVIICQVRYVKMHASDDYARRSSAYEPRVFSYNFVCHNCIQWPILFLFHSRSHYLDVAHSLQFQMLPCRTYYC